MRLYQVLLGVFVAATLLGVARSEVGRVTLVIFFTGLGEVVLGATALMHLFRSVGEFGRARTLAAHLEALAATAVILLLATVSMNVVLWLGLFLLQSLAAR